MVTSRPLATVFTMNPSPDSGTASPSAYPASAVVTGEAKSFGVESPACEEKAGAATAKAGSTMSSAVISASSALVVSEIEFDLEDSSGDEKSRGSASASRVSRVESVVAPEYSDGGDWMFYDELTNARWCEVRLYGVLLLSHD